jgi:hypothetical protein
LKNYSPSSLRKIVDAIKSEEGDLNEKVDTILKELISVKMLIKECNAAESRSSDVNPGVSFLRNFSINHH